MSVDQDANFSFLEKVSYIKPGGCCFRLVEVKVLTKKIYEILCSLVESSNVVSKVSMQVSTLLGNCEMKTGVICHRAHGQFLA